MEEEKIARSSVEERTPITEAGGVLSSLCDIWIMWNMHEKMDFWECIFKELWDENGSGDIQIDELIKIENMIDWQGEPFDPGFKAAIVQIATLHVACAYVIQAFKAKKSSKVAWAYACKANHWLGILQGIISGRGLERENGPSNFARRGADAMHIENRKMKAEVFEWLDTNMADHKNMSRAASAIAGKVVPIVFTTAQSWVSEWKKIQSKGKL